MISARENILERIRNSGLPAKPQPEIPNFTRIPVAEFIPHFRRGLEAMAGKFVDQRPPDIKTFLQQAFPNAKNFCSAVPEIHATSTPEQYSNWASAGDIDVTIVRSPMGIAETGSILLSDKDLRVNTIGFLAHDIVALLDPI